VGLPRRPVRTRADRARDRGARRVPAGRPGQLLDRDDRQLAHRDQGRPLHAGHGVATGARAAPEHAVREGRRRRRRRHPDGDAAPDPPVRQLLSLRPDSGHRDGVARPVLPRPRVAVLPAGSPQIVDPRVHHGAHQLHEPGPAPGGPAAPPGGPPAGRVRPGVRDDDPACAAVGGGQAGVLPAPGQLGDQPGRSPRRRGNLGRHRCRRIGRGRRGHGQPREQRGGNSPRPPSTPQLSISLFPAVRTPTPGGTTSTRKAWRP